jgi:hypothetical protein
MHSNIEAQKKDRLKQPVPDGKFIDTRDPPTMWGKTPEWRSGQDYHPFDGRCHCEPWEPNPWCEISPHELARWQEAAKPLGTEDDWKRLIEGWDVGNKCGTTKDPVRCPNPLEYLSKEVGLKTAAPAGTPRDYVGYVWLGPIPVSRKVPADCISTYITITRIDLIWPKQLRVFQNTLYKGDTNMYWAHAMNRQAVAPGTYWWPLGWQ